MPLRCWLLRAARVTTTLIQMMDGDDAMSCHAAPRQSSTCA
jgi:hypothetical protein